MTKRKHQQPLAMRIAEENVENGIEEHLYMPFDPIEEYSLENCSSILEAEMYFHHKMMFSCLSIDWKCFARIRSLLDYARCYDAQLIKIENIIKNGEKCLYIILKFDDVQTMREFSSKMPLWRHT